MATHHTSYLQHQSLTLKCGGCERPGAIKSDPHLEGPRPPHRNATAAAPLVPLQLVTAKQWYRLLLVSSVCQRPTAEVAWAEQFPGRNIADIWKKINLKYCCHSVFNTEFKIRHRRIFTAVILHQIDTAVYSRRCPVCAVQDAACCSAAMAGLLLRTQICSGRCCSACLVAARRCMDCGLGPSVCPPCALPCTQLCSV